MRQSNLFKTKGVQIETRSVSKKYQTAAEEVEALKEIDWEVGPGEAAAIMGPSGCGKTTLLNLLGGVDRPTSGKIIIDSHDLTAMNERQLEVYRLRKVGFVFQFFNLVPTMTALENLELPMILAGLTEAESRERALALLDIVGLDGKGNKRPEELSGGEQQRVGVTLALSNDPALILADEPTGNLDTRNAEIIAKLLCSLASDYGKTVIMVSHDPKSVAHFPNEFAMRDGRFVSLEAELQPLPGAGH